MRFHKLPFKPSNYSYVGIKNKNSDDKRVYYFCTCDKNDLKLGDYMVTPTYRPESHNIREDFDLDSPVMWCKFVDGYIWPADGPADREFVLLKSFVKCS